MAVNVYEGMFILDSNRYARHTEEVAGQIPELIQEAGGEILVNRLWEERRLAYHIRGHRKGTYWLTYFRMDGDKLAGMQRQCRLRESILRVLFVKIEPRIVDAVVAHAQASTASGRRKEKEGAEGKEGAGGKEGAEEKEGAAAQTEAEAAAVAETEKSGTPTPDIEGQP